MSAPDSLTEAISRHFDDANDPAQTVLLSKQIATDPQAAISFARAARVHGMLQQSLAPAVTKSRRWKPLLWIGSAAAVVIGSFLTWKWAGPHEGAQTKVRITQITDTKDDPKETLTKTSGKVRRVKPAALSANAPDAEVKPVDWNNYFVDLDIHGMTVENALASLKAAISEVNFYQRSELDQVDFESPGHPGAVIPSFLPRNSSVSDLFKVIAMHTPFVRRGPLPAPSNVSFEPFPGPIRLTDFGAEVDSAKFKISPSLASSFLDLMNFHSSILQDSSVNGGRISSLDFKPVLAARFGIGLVGEERVSWDLVNSVIEMNAHSSKLNQFAARLEILRSSSERSGSQIQMTQLLLTCPQDLLPAGFDQETGMLMDAASFTAFAERMAKEKNVTILSHPKIIARKGQGASVEIGQEVRPGFWIGKRCIIESVRLLGETISCVGTYENHEPAGSTVTEFETYIPDGQTVLFTIDAPGEKGVVLCCMTAEKLSSDGKLLGTSKKDLPLGVPVPEKPGFLYSPYAPDSGMVDVRGIFSGTKVACPYTQKIFRVP